MQYVKNTYFDIKSRIQQAEMVTRFINKNLKIYLAVHPPSIIKFAPVIYPDAPEHKNTNGPA